MITIKAVPSVQRERTAGGECFRARVFVEAELRGKSQCGGLARLWLQRIGGIHFPLIARNRVTRPDKQY